MQHECRLAGRIAALLVIDAVPVADVEEAVIVGSISGYMRAQPFMYFARFRRIRVSTGSSAGNSKVLPVIVSKAWM